MIMRNKIMPRPQANEPKILTPKPKLIDLTELSDSSPEPDRRPSSHHRRSAQKSATTKSPSPAKRHRHSIESSISAGALAPSSSSSQSQTLPAAETRRDDLSVNLPPIGPQPRTESLSSYFQKAPEKTKVQILHDHLHEFDSRTQRTVQNISLSTSEDMSAEVKEMWTQSTTTWPHIFESDQCWVSKRPSSEEMIIHTLDLIAKRKKDEEGGTADAYGAYCPAFRNGMIDPKIDSRTAITQLYEPNKTHCIALIGYRLPKLLPDGSVQIPGALSTVVEPHDEVNLQVLLTPKFWVTDLHIDNSDGISTTLGPTEKIWMMFPPTPKNLELMQKADAQKEKLARIGKDLEGGLIFKTTSADVMYIPVGCIHTVFTVHGGFLLTMEFNTPLAAPVLSRLFNYEFDKFKEDYAHAELPTQFIESVELALKHNHPLVGLKAWIDSEEHIRRWNDNYTAAKYEFWNERRSGWKRKVDEVWKEFFKDRESKKIGCPCGRMKPGESLQEHFRSAHAFTKATPKTRTVIKEVPQPVERPKRKRSESNSPTRKSQEDVPTGRKAIEDIRSEDNSRRGRLSTRRTVASGQPSKEQENPPTIQPFEDSMSDDVLEAQIGPVKLRKSFGSSRPSKRRDNPPNIRSPDDSDFEESLVEVGLQPQKYSSRHRIDKSRQSPPGSRGHRENASDGRQNMVKKSFGSSGGIYGPAYRSRADDMWEDAYEDDSRVIRYRRGGRN